MYGVGKKAITGKNDLTRCKTHREAVSGTVIHSIFDGWHYKVLRTCALTRSPWHTCDYVRSILYIMLLLTKLPNALYCTLPSSQDALKHTPSTLSSTLPIALDDTLPACWSIHSHKTLSSTLPSTIWNTLQIALDDTLPGCLTIRSQGSYQDAPKYTPNTLSSTPLSTFSSSLLNMLSRTLLIALDDIPAAYLTVCSEVCSQDALKHTPGNAHKYTLQRQDTSNPTRLYAPMYAPRCSIQKLAELLAPGTGRRVAGGEWREASGRRQVAGGGWREMLGMVVGAVRKFKSDIILSTLAVSLYTEWQRHIDRYAIGRTRARGWADFQCYEIWSTPKSWRRSIV